MTILSTMIRWLLLFSCLFTSLLFANDGKPAKLLNNSKVAESATSSDKKFLSSALQKKIDLYVTAEMKRQRIPGLALGIYRYGIPVYSKGYGIANLEWQTAVDANTLMQAGSLGKQFVATAIMRLAEQGKLNIHDSITRYFPEAPQSWQPITLANMLSHTSGIGGNSEPDLDKPGGIFDMHRDFTENELVANITRLPLKFAASTDWEYNNANYVLLGILIHRVTGKFYGDYLHDAFFAPFGMNSTRVNSDKDIIPHRASGYQIEQGELKNHDWISATFSSTADGTIYTTVEDMAKWDRALYGNKLLTDASKKQMWTPFMLSDGKVNSDNYGFGWWIREINGHKFIEHNGVFQGFTSHMRRYRDKGLSVVVFANLDYKHAPVRQINAIVSGIVSPELMPPLLPALTDDPVRSGKLRDCLMHLTDGKKRSSAINPKLTCDVCPEESAELIAALPQGWQKAPMTLLLRQDDKDGNYFGYRMGPEGNTRLFAAKFMPSGKISECQVIADPNTR